MHVICRNEVKDYAEWREVFDEDAIAHEAAGLALKRVWQDIENKNTVFIVFEVSDLKQARVFLDSDDLKSRREKSGVTEVTYNFVEADKLYEGSVPAAFKQPF